MAPSDITTYDQDITTFDELVEVSQDLKEQLLEADFGPDLSNQQVIALAEEVGEFVGAFRRFKGMARRNGSFAEMAEELADVIIAAFITAVVLDINLPAEINYKLDLIFSRGMREAAPTNVLISPAAETSEARNAE
jgi:NTP pyrophosphatase (non-canonical NTP hydrolase)